ncbi:YheC/YheD family endospore coat-associated protein [Cytobacillus massiliigabonensis]|uniref:YheC/YheD family endospore coat-associated protein n=1 Tax=Cytobacillus massiliigabonensis TaxID=1871011 RepID=UPI001F221B70|nr:YheC/YheD family protein [Cytobacillus massiliigabonensis]
MTFSLLPITIIPAQTFHPNDESLKISHSLIHYWDIDTSKPITISVGGNQTFAMVVGAAITKDEIIFEEGLFQKLSIPVQESPWIASFSHMNHTLTLGPVIGILTEYTETEKEPHFRSIHAFCKELHDLVSEIGGFLFVFQLADWTDTAINGYYYQNKHWQKASVPLPNVIYNRIHSRRLEASRLFETFKTEITGKNIAIFNDRFLSKEMVHHLLYSEEYMKPYLPDTWMLTEHSLQDMLKKYSSIFIKPIHGSQGRNIIKVFIENDVLKVKMSTGTNKDRTFQFNDHMQFYKWLLPHLEKRTYLIQQAIPLIAYKKKLLDFRILCHKNFQNTWKVTSAVARLSADQQFVSNIARGGDVMKPVHVLSLLSNRETAVQQLKLMKELAIEASSLVSQISDGVIGELGVDIGVDEEGKLWIIEINSKPSKNFEEESNKIRPSAKALLEYCTFLSFNKGRYE